MMENIRIIGFYLIPCAPNESHITQPIYQNNYNQFKDIYRKNKGWKTNGSETTTDWRWKQIRDNTDDDDNDAEELHSCVIFSQNDTPLDQKQKEKKNQQE